MNWLKQSSKEPLFPDVLWSRPENRRHAGKLLIIGGHAQSFSAVSEAYGAAMKAGAGSTRVIVPQKLHAMLKNVFPEADYAPSNEIGSFSRQALAPLLDAADWADATLLAGDFGRNSETAVLLESFAGRYGGRLALTGDSLDYFLTTLQPLINRPDTLIIATISQLQKIASPQLLQQNADLAKVIGQIEALVADKDLSIITVHSNQVIVARSRQISTTPTDKSAPDAALAAYATGWWLQQPDKAFEALTTGVHCLAVG